MENSIPKHVALIMDGNGRWAKKRNLPRILGHKEGANRIIEIVLKAKELGIEALTMFAFSTENWNRPKEEVNYIFALLQKLLKKGKDRFKKENIKVTFIGNINELDKKSQKIISKTEEETKDNDGVVMNLAINYGGRSEIVEAVKTLIKDYSSGEISESDINESLFEKYLMTCELPDIDLLVRTSGEVRISNFLLWQIAYSELIFTSVYWPDFTPLEFEKCIEEYSGRNRRFGKIK